jgi:hypothetical protein
MKKFLIVTAIAGIMALTSNQSNAQVSINVNIGAQPTWVPAGYQNVNYYYLPEVQSYYYVPERRFVYLHNNTWVRSASLPARYRNYDLNRGRKVVVRGNTPFGYRNVSNVRYVENRATYRNYDPRGNGRKFDNRNKFYKHDNGNHNGHFKGHDKGRRH